MKKSTFGRSAIFAVGIGISCLWGQPARADSVNGATVTRIAEGDDQNTGQDTGEQDSRVSDKWKPLNWIFGVGDPALLSISGNPSSSSAQFYLTIKSTTYGQKGLPQGIGLGGGRLNINLSGYTPYYGEKFDILVGTSVVGSVTLPNANWMQQSNVTITSGPLTNMKALRITYIGP